jgi:hypothetical protein
MSLFENFWKTFEHVETSIDINFSIIIGLFVLINIGYYILDWYLAANFKLYEWYTFARKRYIIKNILKSIYLSLGSVYTSWIIFNFVYTGIWTNYQIHNLGLFYMLPDLISLFRVPNLHRNTIQHHVSVVILVTLNLFCDYSKESHWRGMVIYAYMSMLTGIVNFYLGYRLLSKNDKVKLLIAKIAFWNYLGSILINWLYQVYVVVNWIFFDFPLWGLYIYIIMIYFVVVDDIILLGFLNYASTPKNPKYYYNKVLNELKTKN